VDGHAARARVTTNPSADLHAPYRALEAISAARPHSSNPTTTSRSEGRPVVRSPEQLRLHPALKKIGWIGVICEINEAVRPTNLSVTEPILITTCGIILAGIGRWRSALLNDPQEINCIEYSFNEEEALQFIICHHQPQRGWNAFIRIRLALTLEPYFQQRARENMGAGGKCKGLANLPEAQHIDVRQEIARVAGPGACARNVSNVKMILQFAHPKLIDALTDGRLRISRAVSLCKLPKVEQLEQFIRYSEERAITKVIRQSIARPKDEKIRPGIVALLKTIQRQETRLPGSVAIRFSRDDRTVILIVRDLSPASDTQEELELS
jgi:hypothetical protein